MRERSAIVHPDIDRTPVVEIRHPDDARQRQRAMCGADLVHVEDFAVRRRLAVELRTVPGSDAGLPIFVIGLRVRSEEHTSELQSLMRISYAVFCLKKKKASITKQYKSTS